MSAEIIQFIRGPKRHGEHSDFPTIAFRSAARREDLMMEHADAAPSEDVNPEPAGSGDG